MGIHTIPGISKNLFDAQTILAAILDNTPIALSVAEQRLVGRITGGDVTSLTATQIRTLLNIEDGSTADQTKAEIDALGLSHDSLADVSADDHHTKYTDAEAKTQAEGAKLDDHAAPDDNTDLDFSTALHGLVPKGTNVGDFLKDDGTWSAVGAGASAAQALAFALSN